MVELKKNVWQLAIISLISVNQVAFKAVFQLQNVIRRDLLKENWVKSLRLYDLQITLASKQDLILPTPLSSFKSYVRSKNWVVWRKTLNAAWWCNVARRRVRHNVRITTSPIPNWAELNKSDLWVCWCWLPPKQVLGFSWIQWGKELYLTWP